MSDNIEREPCIDRICRPSMRWFPVAITGILASAVCLVAGAAPAGQVAAEAPHIVAADILQRLGGRSDRNFLGRPGNLSAVVGEKGARLIYMSNENLPLHTSLIVGKVAEWRPDFIRLEPGALKTPEGAPASLQPERFCWVGAHDTLVGQWVFHNTGTQPASVRVPVSFSGASDPHATARLLRFTVPGVYPSLFKEFHGIVAASQDPGALVAGATESVLNFDLSISPGQTRTLTVALALGPDADAASRAAIAACAPDSRDQSTHYWTHMLTEAIPAFSCSDPFLEKLYYFRWYSLLTKVDVGGYGRWKDPATREGVVGFNGVITYSGGPNTIDLRWMRSPDYAWGNLRSFFNNLHDGKLANHIYPDSIDHDSANIAPGPDGKPIDVPYHNFLITALLDVYALHPDRAALAELWPRVRQSAAFYDAMLDVDGNGLYETWPWSNITGQEFSAQFEYFHPYDQLLYYDRTWSPKDDAEAAQAADRIESAVTMAPGITIPRTAAAMRLQVDRDRHYRQETVDENCYAIREFQSLATLARILGDGAAAGYQARSDRTRQLVLEKMWDPQTHFFYDQDQPTKRRSLVKSPTGFYPFWAHIAEKQHLPELDHLFNPDEFWTAYPLPSISMDAPKLKARRKLGWTYWNWNNWPMTTSHVVDGAAWAAEHLDASLTPRVGELFMRYVKAHFLKGDLNRPCIPENFDPVTGRPNGPNLDYAHSYFIDLVMRHVCGIEPDPSSDAVRIQPLDLRSVGVSWFEVSNVRIRDHDIGVHWRDQRLTVTVDGKIAKTQEGLEPMTLHLASRP